MDIKQLVIDEVKNNWSNEQVDFKELEQLFSEIPDINNGDVCVPCFSLAKTLRKSPQILAQDFMQQLSQVKDFKYIVDITAVNGYLNFFVDRKAVSDNILCNIITKDKDYGRHDIGKGKTLTIDYSSINLAKYMHIGHLKTTMIGASLYNIYKFLGYKVIGINYIGDYGTPFGKMITAIKHWGSVEEVKKQGVEYIQGLYVKFNQECEHDQSLNDEARQWFKKIEDGDKEANELYKLIIDISIVEAEKNYEILGIKFDSWRGENYYADKMEPVIKELQDKNLLTKSQGADIVDLSDHDLGVALIRKSDGSSLYTTRDLAAVEDRYQNYHFDKALYVTSAEQRLHFTRLFKVVELLQKPYANTLEHVYYGMVSLPSGRISSRYGKQALFKDLLQKAYDNALAVLNSRGTKHENIEQVAKDIASGVIAFEIVKNEKLKDSVFDLEQAVKFEGETSPYMQYTYARCVSIIEKAKQAQLEQLQDFVPNDSYYALVKLLNKFETATIESANNNEPCVITKLMLAIVSEFNKFYNFNRIIDNDTVNKHYLDLVKSVKIVLDNGLRLIGVKPINKM